MSEVNVENPVFDLKLNLDAVNQLLNVLGEQPYNQSAGLISLIMSQAQPQMAKYQAQQAAQSESPPEQVEA